MATEAAIEKAYRKGVSNIADPVVLSLLQEQLRDGNLDGVLAVLDIEPAAFDDLRAILLQTYADAGSEESANVKGARWNSANPRVEAFARDQLGLHIDYITEDMRASVRNTVADGYALGRSVNRIALDIVGRKGASGRREGGIVGLSFQQSQWIANMRRHLLDGDNQRVKQYGVRDRRFDKLLDSGKRLTLEQIDRITRAYSEKLLLVRGRAIAKTERGFSINSGRQESWRQTSEKLGVSPDLIQKEWVHRPFSKEPRITHIAANKQKVMGLDTPFNVGGISIIYPHAPGLPPREVVNCDCQVKYRII